MVFQTARRVCAADEIGADVGGAEDIAPFWGMRCC